MTILIAFHRSDFRTFKHFYLMLMDQHRAEFPDLVSYQRFVELMPSVLGLLCAYLQSRFGSCTGIGFVELDGLGGLRQQANPEKPCFSRSSQDGQDNHGLVFRIQIALGHQ